MGQKVHPIGFRLGVYRNWDARWYADKDYTALLHEDIAIRKLIGGRLRNAGVARIETERRGNELTVTIQTAKPGIVIGKQGASVDALRDELEKITAKKVRVTIHEIKTPELDAKLVAENVASQLEKRIAFRRALKQTLLRSMRAGAKGCKIQVSGRLGGAEMSRREWDRGGRVPLHTLRANIDYGQAEARTTFGRIGVQAWIYKGDFVTATGEPISGTAVRETDESDGSESLERAVPAAPEAAARARATAEPPAAVAVEESATEVRSEAEAEDVEQTLEEEQVDAEEEAAVAAVGVIPEDGEKVEKLVSKRKAPAAAKKPATRAPTKSAARKPAVRKPAAPKAPDAAAGEE
ncbi:MAG: 30S ribosomal protein S3 [Candidatus Dormibacteraeota bacterium]|uniref:Small ribosomal subunit protein uS3 n=1 Tax=Candidatus Aeolococcus gillhamiae TaxID=3127015 RepID=A0A2W5ZE68_9BACT|nr:30S ribosomal protein S3 [Candidatus Dormibacteraeota bacterium]PZR81116.1 MAG: 30S ribosomal protein S3 [Candidatus Dormibacter sp. RRmetagenome_bin12]